MKTAKRVVLTLAAVLVAGATTDAGAEQAPRGSLAHKPRHAPSRMAAVSDAIVEPKAVELLQAMSERLAAARTMTFTAVATYESPSRIGPPLAYTTVSDVTLQRPDKLRVITPADGPASEFYYDGRTITAYEPASNLVAVAKAPPTIDAALQIAYETAAIYFPFADVIVTDPYKDLAEGLKRAFVVGQSRVVGATTTDIVAIVDDHVFAQIWIGVEDKLPRRLRAVFADDPLRLSHDVELSRWRLGDKVPAAVFNANRAAGARRVTFARPDPAAPMQAGAAGDAGKEGRSSGVAVPGATK